MVGCRLRIFFGDVERRFDQRAQLFQRHRFGNVIEGTGFERRHGVLRAAIGGNHRHRQLRVVLADILHQLDAGAVRQAHIG